METSALLYITRDVNRLIDWQVCAILCVYDSQKFILKINMQILRTNVKRNAGNQSGEVTF